MPEDSSDVTGPTLWRRAASLAARFHRNDLRKDKHTPYVAHPVRVMLNVTEIFGCHDEVVIAAALLHDVIEDTGADYDDVAQACGSQVADIVAALTKNMILPEPEREPEYDRRLAEADWRARLVKLGDVLDNLVDMHDRAQPERIAEKCRRAIALAEPDAERHEPTRRGIEAVNSALGERGL